MATGLGALLVPSHLPWALALLAATGAGGYLAASWRLQPLQSLYRQRETPWRNGAVSYAASVALALALWPSEPAFAGWLALAFGDGSATLIGSRWPIIRITLTRSAEHPSAARSLGGLLAFASASFLAIASGLAWWHGHWPATPRLAAIAAASLGAGLSEFLLPRRRWADDNFIVPHAAAALYLLFSRL